MGERKRKQVLEKGKGRGGSEPERARGAFEVHAKRSLRGCFSDFGGKSVSTHYEFALETLQELLKTRTRERGKTQGLENEQYISHPPFCSRVRCQHGDGILFFFFFPTRLPFFMCLKLKGSPLCCF